MTLIIIITCIIELSIKEFTTSALKKNINNVFTSKHVFINKFRFFFFKVNFFTNLTFTSRPISSKFVLTLNSVTKNSENSILTVVGNLSFIRPASAFGDIILYRRDTRLYFCSSRSFWPCTRLLTANTHTYIFPRLFLLSLSLSLVPSIYLSISAHRSGIEHFMCACVRAGSEPNAFNEANNFARGRNLVSGPKTLLNTAPQSNYIARSGPGKVEFCWWFTGGGDDIAKEDRFLPKIYKTYIYVCVCVCVYKCDRGLCMCESYTCT